MASLHRLLVNKGRQSAYPLVTKFISQLIDTKNENPYLQHNVPKLYPINLIQSKLFSKFTRRPPRVAVGNVSGIKELPLCLKFIPDTPPGTPVATALVHEETISDVTFVSAKDIPHIVNASREPLFLLNRQRKQSFNPTINDTFPVNIKYNYNEPHSNTVVVQAIRGQCHKMPRKSLDEVARLLGFDASAFVNKVALCDALIVTLMDKFPSLQKCEKDLGKHDLLAYATLLGLQEKQVASYSKENLCKFLNKQLSALQLLQ